MEGEGRFRFPAPARFSPRGLGLHAPAAPAAPVSLPPQPGLAELFLAFARMSLAGFGGVLVWARRGVEQHRWMIAEEFNETFALCHFLPGPNIVNLSFAFGSRVRGGAGGVAAFAGLVVPPMLIAIASAALYVRYGEIDVLRRTLVGVSCAAVGLLLAVVFKMMMPLVKKRDVIGLLILAAVFIAIGLLRLPLLIGRPLEPRHQHPHARTATAMNWNVNPIWMLVWTLGLMSLLAVGGANSAIPEMHRVAVDVHHWMDGKQFADVFAISQLSPGPNVLIVTLIGYYVAGIAGALAATLAMCGPTALLAFYVTGLLRRSQHSRWPALIQAALVPLSIGLMAASGLILARASDQNRIAAATTAVAAILGVCTRLNPFWMLLAGGLLGFAGVI